jgi:hypothetical protein
MRDAHAKPNVPIVIDDHNATRFAGSSECTEHVVIELIDRDRSPLGSAGSRLRHTQP